MSGRTSYESGASPAILKISWNKWRRKNLTRSWVLSPIQWSLQKETEMITSWTRLKSCNLTVFKRKKRTIHWASCTRGSFTTQKKSIAELHMMHAQIPSPKTTKSLRLNHRRKEGLPSLIQATWIELLYFSFWLQNCLFLCHARMSFRHMTSFCKLNET